MINDDHVILDLFRDELAMENVCAVYGRFYERDHRGWLRAPDGDSAGGYAAILSVVGADGRFIPLVEERDLLTRMAKAIIDLRDLA